MGENPGEARPFPGGHHGDGDGYPPEQTGRDPRRRRPGPAGAPLPDGEPRPAPPPRPRLRRPRLDDVATATRACSAASKPSSTTGASRAPATSPSSRSTRASSTPRAPRSRPTRSTSTASKIVELAVEGGCNAVASTFGVLGSVSRKWAHKIPFIVKLNHNELLTYPNKFDQVMFGDGRAGLEHGGGRGRRHHLLRLRGVDAPAPGGQPRPSPRPMSWAWPPCSGATCATPRSSRRHRLRRLRRPDRAGQPPRRHHRGGHHQAEAAREQRRLHAPSSYGKTSKLVYEQADHRPPHRPHPLPGGQLLHGPCRADQLAAARPRGRPTSRRPCAPRSSTSGPAAPA